jgi:hypothetical protein
MPGSIGVALSACTAAMLVEAAAIAPMLVEAAAIAAMLLARRNRAQHPLLAADAEGR